MPAFFWVHLDGYPVQWGPLSFYGIEQPQPGVHIDQHIVFLQDIFPPGKTETLSLPCVETRTGIFAELYIFPAAVGHWVVLLDVTQEAHTRHLLQQKANELKLSRTQQTTHRIEGSLILLGEEEFSSKGRRLVDIGIQESAKQKRLIQKVLPTFAADVESRMEIATVPSEIPDIATGAQVVVASTTPAFTVSQVGLQLDPQAEWTKNWRVVSEKSRLERALTNLAENALRHNPRSTVRIGVERSR
jgi:signal transduction histidine kinase